MPRAIPLAADNDHPRDLTTGMAWGPLLVRWLLVGLTFLLATFELADYDIWWHLRTGQLIQERGVVPDKDWYSFTATDRDWLDVHWGFQVLFSWLHARFGVPGMVLAKAAIAALAVAVALSAYKPTWSPTVQILIWLPTLFLMSSRFYVRPEILTLLFTALFLTILFHAEERPGWLWLLPPLQVLWANVQGLFAFGPILIGMYLVEAVLRSRQSRGLWRHLAPVSLLTAAACLASPYGVRNVLFVLELWAKMQPKEDLFRKHIAELQDFPTFWKNGGFVNPYAILFVVVGGLAAASLLLASWRILAERRAFWVLAALGFGYLGIRAIRNGNHYAMVVGTAATWCLGSLTESDKKPRVLGWLATGGLTAALAVFVATGRWHLLASPDRQLGLENRASFNSPAAMKLAGQPGMPERAAIFNLGHAAEYIYFNGPQRRVLFDGRLEVYSDQQFREYIDLENAIAQTDDAVGGQPAMNWDAVLKSQACELAIVDGEHNHPMQAALFAHSMWRCVHYDEVVAVFLRRSYAAPAAVTDFQFSTALFGPGLPALSALPLWTAAPRWLWFPPSEAVRDRIDIMAERSGFLGLGMMARPAIAPPIRLANAVYSLRHADAATARRPWSAEARRFRGIALFLAAAVLDAAPERASLDQVWSGERSLLGALSAAAFRQALECNPDDYSANFYLLQAATQSGFIDESAALLERLARITASNVARQQMRDALATETAKVEAKLVAARQSADVSNRSVENLRRLAQLGLLAEPLRQLDVPALAEQPFEAAELIGGWFMQLGECERARAVFESARPTTDVASQRRSLRLSQCMLALGNYADAARELPNAGVGYEPMFLRAWLALLKGDRDAMRAAAKAASGSGLDEQSQARLRLVFSLAD